MRTQVRLLQVAITTVLIYFAWAQGSDHDRHPWLPVIYSRPTFNKDFQQEIFRNFSENGSHFQASSPPLSTSTTALLTESTVEFPSEVEKFSKIFLEYFSPWTWVGQNMEETAEQPVVPPMGSEGNFKILKFPTEHFKLRCVFFYQ